MHPLCLLGLALAWLGLAIELNGTITKQTLTTTTTISSDLYMIPMFNLMLNVVQLRPREYWSFNFCLFVLVVAWQSIGACMPCALQCESLIDPC